MTVKPTGKKLMHTWQGDTITNWEVMERRIEQVLLTANEIAFDVETISTSDRSLVGIGIATSPRESFYFPWDSSAIHYAWRVLYNPLVKKIAHNCMFDLDVLWDSKPDVTDIEDTAVMSRFDNHFPATLEAMSVWLGRQGPMPMGQVMKLYKVKQVDELPFEVTANKCLLDAQLTL